MTTSTRFQNVFNNTGAAFSAASFVSNYQDDGDDRLIRTIQRTYVAADIGTGAGQTQDNTGGANPGCIITVLPGNELITNILAIIAQTYRQAGNGGYILDSVALSGGTQLAQLVYNAYTSDNSLRLLDAGNNASVRVAAGDFTMLTLIMGQGVPWVA